MTPKHIQEAAEREFPVPPLTGNALCDSNYIITVDLQRAAYIKACEHMEASASELVRALRDLIFTAEKLWDEVKPIKDTEIMKATHPIIQEAKATLASYPKVGEEGKEAKEFIRWVRLEGWEHTPNELNCWHRSLNGQKTEKKTEDELYQLFKQNPQP